MAVGRRCVISMLATLSLGIAVLSLTQAAAATGPVIWTQDIQGGIAGEVDPNAAILTHPNGDVTFGGCAEDEPIEAIETWTSGHSLVGSRPVTTSPDPQLCDGTGLTDAQGNVYSLMLNQAADRYDIVAFKPNGNSLWPAPKPLPTTCPGNPLSLGYSQPVLGADGNIYGLVYWGQVNGCPTALKLYGINHQTGALLFADTLNPDSGTVTSDVSAYAGGLVVRADNQVSYYNYGGIRIAGPFSMDGEQMDRDEGVAATISGRVFVATGKATTPTSTCPLTFTLNAIEAYQPSGRVWRTSITGCKQATQINAMPDGGVAMLMEDFTTGTTSSSEILRYSSTGTLLWPLPASDMLVDTNGNIITETGYQIDDPDDPAINGEPEVRVDAYNAVSGTQIYQFDTANFDDDNSYVEPVNAIGLAEDRIYLGLQDCPGNITPTGEGRCDTAPQLYAIDAPGVGIDYPRGAMFGVKPPPLTYVALGDSYSSGEGSPDPGYMTGTSTKTNQCHRSIGAWPELVAKAVVAKYPYMVFRACSGATTQDFFQSNASNANEPDQLSWLNDATGLVTLTIGGNNVDFHNVMEYCAHRRAGDKTCQQKFGKIVNADLAALSSDKTTGDSTLAAVFSRVRREAPYAKILVIGYPRLFPTSPPKGCDTGLFGFTFLQSDIRWINSEELKLDNEIEATAKRFGLTYVDTFNAFQGHEICTADPYVNRVMISKLLQQSGDFHPNLKGQQALAKVVERYI
jgi:lysophospholipase L1-like esterase